MTKDDQKNLLLLGGAGAVGYILLSSKNAFGGSGDKSLLSLVEAMQNSPAKMAPVPGTGKTVNLTKTYYWAAQVVEVIKTAARGIDNMKVVRNVSQQIRWASALKLWGQKVYEVGVSDPGAEITPPPSIWDISEYIMSGGTVGKWGTLNEMPKDVSDKFWSANKVFAVEMDANIALAEKAKKLPTAYYGLVASTASSALNWSATTFSKAVGSGVKGFFSAFTTTDMLIAGGAVLGILALVNKG